MSAAAAASDFDTLRMLALAAALAALIGLEREIARKPAGLRTHILVGVSAALLVRLADLITAHVGERLGSDPLSVDPVRIIQAIIVGISFLGAGTIIQGADARVEGLTTAASILLTAALGIAVALGRDVLATSLAACVASVLFLLGKAERYCEGRLPRRPEPESEGSAPESELPDPAPQARRRRRRAPPGSD